MKNIKTTSDLIAKCRGKYLLMQSRKDVHSELDARKASNDLSYLFIVKVEETGPAKAMRMHDTPYYSYAAYLANGRFETKIEIDHLLAMVQYNVKRGNVVTVVDEYAKPELIAKLAEYGTAVADRIKLNLALSDWSVYKAPAKVINQVHANNLTIIILAKQIKALLTEWMMGMEIKPR
jgi:hypothetical protein